MNARSLRALIVLNIVLLVALTVTMLTPQATFAQLGGGGDEYLMISGRAQGREQQAAVYVLNVNNGRVLALMYNSTANIDNSQRLQFLGARDIQRDLEAAAQGGR